MPRQVANAPYKALMLHGYAAISYPQDEIAAVLCANAAVASGHNVKKLALNQITRVVIFCYTEDTVINTTL
jgi:hypothetical protein